MSGKGSRSWWVYAAAVLALLVCLWIGWRDFDPNVPQEVVRETIRATPRLFFQLLVQYVAPLVLVAFLVTELVARFRTNRARPDNSRMDSPVNPGDGEP